MQELTCKPGLSHIVIRGVHYGTFKGSVIFISNAEYVILFQNYLLGAIGLECPSAITRAVN